MLLGWFANRQLVVEEFTNYGSLRTTFFKVWLFSVRYIVPYFARKIVAYGQRLGGYVSIDQLDEIEDFPQRSSPASNPTLISRSRRNFCCKKSCRTGVI